MANEWLRLWHDMPNDPKFKTIAKKSGQPLPLVICVFLHVLVNASANASERGRTKGLSIEDIATALDSEEEQVAAIMETMQGRLIDGDLVMKWEKRQPLREDGSAERAKAWRQAQKAAKQPQPNDAGTDESNNERNQTQENKNKRPDKDTEEDKDIKEKINKKEKPKPLSVSDLMADGVSADAAAEFLELRKRKRAPVTPIAWQGIKSEALILDWPMERVVRECLARGWQGFKAEWVNNTNGRASPQIGKQSALEERNKNNLNEILSEGVPNDRW